MEIRDKIIEIKLKLEEETLTYFLDMLIEKIKNEGNLFQKEIAKKIDISASDFSLTKNYGSELKKEELLYKILQNYNTDYYEIIEKINKDIKRRSKEYEKRKKNGLFDILGVIYLPESNQLENMVFNIDIEDGIISTTRNNGFIYIQQRAFWYSLSDLELTSNENVGDTIRIILNEGISRETFDAKKVTTGVLTYLENNQIRVSQLLLFNPSLIEEVDLLYEELKYYFQNPHIQNFFLSDKDKNINTLLKEIYYYKKENKTVVINLPKELIISYKQFLNFFSEYVLVAKGVEIEFDVSSKASALEINVKTNENASMENIGEYLNEYLGFSKQNIDKLKIPVETEISKTEFDILALDIKNQVTSLKHSLEIAHLKNNMLSDNNEHLKQIISDFAKKDIIIQNQLIQGGEQQFADKIKNRNK